MQRKIYQKLLEWKNETNRKPLILQGARQVGKTYILNEFARNEYDNYVYCNFEYELDLYNIFKDNLNPYEIIKKLQLVKKCSINPNNTLIIFDEVQYYPQALTSLKYFYELASNYHIIASGSLLGIAVNRDKISFPVGKVETLTMYPMDFEEYLMANNKKEYIDMIKEHYSLNSPIDLTYHEELINLYKRYLYVGGMPAIVKDSIENDNYYLVRVYQSEMLNNYLRDMSKYNKSSEVLKTQLLFLNISTQLAKENKKFKYSDIQNGARANKFENSLEWINLSGIATQLFKLNDIKIPLNAYKSLSDFKVYMNDIGLLGASQGLSYEDLMYDNYLFNDFKGGLTENYVYNQLTVNGLSLFYWTSNGVAEIDFITRINNDIIPLEVKSSTNVKSKSLKIYSDKYNPKYCIRLSLKNFGFENNIKSVPLYAAFCIK